MDAKGLKILMISTDRKICDPGSAVAERMKEYGALVEELHIVLLSDKSHGLKGLELGKNIWVYPTNSASKFFRPLDAARLGKRLIFDKKFVRGQSLITTQDPFECGWAGLKAKKKWRIPLEVQLHTDPYSPYFKGFLNAVRRRLARKVLRHADSVRVVNENLKSKLTNLTNSEITVLPIYTDKRKVEEGKVIFDLHSKFHWKFIILAVSRLAEEKNLGFALEVLAKVRETYKDVGLVIVGSGPEEEKLKNLAKKLGVHSNVAFEGWQENLESYYKTANMFLQTSSYEGYGMSLIEAGLYGLPILTTPVGIALQLENGKDAYVYPKNLGYFSGAIMDLVENNEKREMMSINIRHTLESTLISKEEYLSKMKTGWEKTSARIK